MAVPNILKTAAATALWLVCLVCKAQEKPVYNVPSPDIASLGTYGSVPVSLFTGTPDISVPLYDLRVGNYTFPITATYHTATVKPHSQPGITGLGWSLHTDGYISRTVHGVYDEKQCSQCVHGYYGHAGKMKGMTAERFRQIVRDSTSNDGLTHDWYELAPDEFSFDFCGYSGRFYLNGDGRIVLERRMLNESGARKALDTYYIHAPFGNLLAVLPPAASEGIGTGSVDKELLDAYAYQYRYDDYDRMTARKLPGCGWVRYAYDGNDRMVFSQDAEQRKQGRSTFVLCDSLGRQCVTGTCAFTFPRGYEVQGEVYCHYTGKENGLAGYAYSGITLADARAVTATYYDSYDFLDDLCRDSKLPKGDLRYGQQAECVTGLVTGRMSSVLEPTDSVAQRKLFSVIRYDHRARQAKVETENLMEGHDVEDTELDFLGRVTKRHLLHHVPLLEKDHEEEYTYIYDHAGRLLKVEHGINGGQTRVLTDNQYDGLGRLTANRANGSEALATGYDYNLRSWLTKVTNPAFEEELLYNENGGTSKSLYCGNISAMK